MELLVVIGVAAFLATMIFGVASFARNRARAAVCVINRRGVMVATMQYVTDYKLTEASFVDPTRLVQQKYLKTIDACPCQGWYSIEEPGVTPKCTVIKSTPSSRCLTIPSKISSTVMSTIALFLRVTVSTAAW